ncbi:MAG: flagellar hook-associated protein FlgK [Burkholderiaceae bacterium]
MGLLNIGASALSAAYTQIQTVGNNISNANTVGYHRQTVVQSEVGTNTGAEYVGMGVQIDAVQRQYDQFVERAVFVAQSTASAAQARSTQTSALENLFADPDTGLGASMDALRTALADLSNTPNSSAVREVVLSSAQNLASRVSTLDTQIEDLARDTDLQLEAAVGELNTMLADLAELNGKLAFGSGTGTALNDLLDQRDALINEINTQIRGNAYINDDNTVTMFASTGESLVAGTSSSQFSIGTDTLGTGRPQLMMKQGAVDVPVNTVNIGGGAIAGLLRFRNEDLVSAQNQIGQMAAAIAGAFNAVQTAGVDESGQAGQPLFDVASPTVGAATTNTGSGAFAATVVDASQLKASDYRIDYDGTDYVVTRLSDGQSTTAAVADFPLEVDGLQFALTPGALSGDRFLVKSGSVFAGEFGVRLTSGSQIAAAMAAYPAATSSNQGTMTVAGFSVADGADANLTEPVTLTFHADGTFDVSGTGTGDPTGLTYASDQPITYNGWTLTLQGQPAEGDTVTVSATQSPQTDNRNAKQLYEAIDAASVDGRSFNDAYAALVADVGARAASANTATTIAEQSLVNAEAARDNISGVNLDEEAVRLLQYQQAYQAAAKIIATANTLFDSLLSAVNN